MSLTAPARPQPNRLQLHARMAHQARRLACLAVLMTVLSSPLAHAQPGAYAEVARLVRAGQLQEALGRADQYLAGQPRDPQMRFLKGVIQTESGQPDQAMATFTKLTEEFPELPEPYNNLAVLYAAQGRFEHARAALDMAIRANPAYATAHENLGDVYARLAIQSYSRAAQLDADNPALAPKLRLIRSLFASDNPPGGAAGS
jgi:Flp pilus assembly protein TadD